MINKIILFLNLKEPISFKKFWFGSSILFIKIKVPVLVINILKVLVPELVL